MRSACEREPAIVEAYLYQSQIVELDEPPQLTVGLRLQASVAEGEYKRLAESINGDVNPQRWGYESLDYHLLEGDLLETVRSSDHVVIHRRENL